MLSLLVMLTERIDFSVAWPAVQGWAGDSIVAFERAGTTCVRSAVVFDGAGQAERFGNAFAQWSKGRSASHRRDDRSVLFESCPRRRCGRRAQGRARLCYPGPGAAEGDHQRQRGRRPSAGRSNLHGRRPDGTTRSEPGRTDQPRHQNQPPRSGLLDLQRAVARLAPSCQWRPDGRPHPPARLRTALGHQPHLAEVALGEAPGGVGAEEAVRVAEGQVQPPVQRDRPEAQGQR